MPKKYLVPCLESVARQSFRDFEVLCINDGSQDGTEAIVKSFADKDSRFRLINQENAGCSAARNHGIAVAEAPYIAFLIRTTCCILRLLKRCIIW